MIFNETTRRLESETGYLKRKEEEEALYSDHAIWLGIYDSPDNYEEISKEAYEEYCLNKGE